MGMSVTCSAAHFPYTTLFRSVAGGLLSYYYVEPLGQIWPERWEAWIGIGAFLVAALITSALLSRASSAHESAELRSEEHTSELQSLRHVVCRRLLEKKKILHP